MWKEGSARVNEVRLIWSTEPDLVARGGNGT